MFLFNIEMFNDNMKSLSNLQTNFDLSKYKIASEDHDKERIYEVYDVINEDTQLLFSANAYMIEIHQFSRCEIQNFCREIHCYFKNEPKPVIINERKKSDQNKEKRIIGTPAYLAPEIYLTGEYSDKSDVYSFSLIMYEIITKNIPFTNINSINEFQQNIIEKNERPSIEACISTAYRQLI